MDEIKVPVPQYSNELVPAELVAKARDFAKASKAGSTLRCYRAIWNIFCEWCTRHGLKSMPAQPESLAVYIADQAERLRPATIKKHLAAISQAHQAAGFHSPTQSEIVHLTMQGLRRTKGTAPNQKAALRVGHVKAMVAVLPNSMVGLRDRALILLGMSTGMRRSEIAGLDMRDLTFEPEGIIITIRKSKRDQEGRGRQVPVPFGKHGSTCPVRAIRCWMQASGIRSGPLFVRLDPAGHGERINPKTVAAVVKRTAARAGLDPTFFGGHSLRRGFATETARAGAAERDIARTTGHASMQVLRGYIEQGRAFESAAAKVLDL